jgi:hypothetical protein
MYGCHLSVTSLKNTILEIRHASSERFKSEVWCHLRRAERTQQYRSVI